MILRRTSATKSADRGSSYRVEVECYKFTTDECLFLGEMRACATDEDRSQGRFEEIDSDGNSSSSGHETDDAAEYDWDASSDDYDMYTPERDPVY